jgi:small subunit ribosomal protein S21
MGAHEKGGFDSKRGLYVEVRNNNIDGAIRSLNSKVKKEGIIKDVKRKEFYEKPSVAKRRKRAEAVRRAVKTRAKNAET